MERLSVLYASALFDLAKERGDVDGFLAQAKLIFDSLQGDDCQRILVHPHISESEKRDFFTKAFAEHINSDLLGFLFLVADKNREVFLLPALSAVIDKIEHYNHKITAKVFFASELSDNQIAAMQDMLCRKLNKTVKISLKIDPSVIGGPYIFVDGFYLDWTVRKRLRDLTVYMKEGCGA